MATYVFKAMDLAGVQAKGEVEADSKQAVAEQLKERGLVVVDIAHKYRSKEINLEVFSRVNAKDLAVASRQLATMVTSGMSIMRALQVLETQTGSKALKEQVRLVIENVVNAAETKRLTFTFPMLNHAANIMFLVEGAEKSHVFAEAVRATAPQFPVQKVSPSNGSVIWFVDQDCARDMKVQSAK